MKKFFQIKVFVLSLISVAFLSWNALASVCFVTDTEDCGGDDYQDYEPDDENRCIKEGYIHSSCPEGYKLGGKKCPYDNYYSDCLIDCPADYVTCQAPYSGYGEACNGRYERCCQTCGAEYTHTEIPEGYVQDGEECFDCSGVTKYKIKEDDCDGYLDCGVVGGAEGAQTCISGTTIKYSECNKCPYEGKLTSCPSHATCTYEECSGLWYIESCESGYVLDSTGMKCVEEDLCANVSCGANAYCSEGKCYCNDGYEGNADTGCTKIDPCDNVSCGANAYCLNGKCYCNSGYEGNANTGCTKIDTDPCANVSCGSNAYCSNGSCYCIYGYEGNAYTGCTKSDPCDGVRCGSNAYCSNGSCYCNSGYEGNAYTGCTKSDPCDNVRCGSNAYCSNGSCYCKSGYEGNPYSGCTQSDPCDGVRCGTNAYCSNGSCYCESGYEGNAYSGCTKSDPCDDVTAVTVPANAHCTSYYSTCSSKCKAWACDDGFTQKGNYCEKVCEVETCTGYSLSTCPSHGNCSTCTLVGSNCAQGATKYRLDSCQSGYTKSGNTCIQACTANSCSGYNLSSCPSHGNCSSCTIKNSDCSTGSTKYKLDSCQSGYDKKGDICVQAVIYGTYSVSGSSYSYRDEYPEGVCSFSATCSCYQENKGLVSQFPIWSEQNASSSSACSSIAQSILDNICYDECHHFFEYR